MTIATDIQDEATRRFDAGAKPTEVHLGPEAAAAFVEEMAPFLDLEVPGMLARFGELDVFVDEGAAPGDWRVA